VDAVTPIAYKRGFFSALINLQIANDPSSGTAVERVVEK
jgi:hypothetical protein